MQNIFIFSSLESEKTTPKPIAAGNEGGITIVIRSINFLARFPPLKPAFISPGMTQKKPKKAHPASKKINFQTSRMNWNTKAFGYKMSRTKEPFAVMNPVDLTNPMTSLPSIFLF